MLIYSLIAVDGAGCRRLSSIVPDELVVELDPEQKKRSLRRRFQKKAVKSSRLGKLTVSYECGTVAEGRRRLIPDDVQRLVPERSTFAYDTIYRAMDLRYLQLNQRETISEIIAEESGFHISTGAVSNLSWLGLAHLEQAHLAKAAILAERYRKDAFIIHIDCTNERGRFNHIMLREARSGNVIYADKISSESSGNIAGVLQTVKQHFGCPDVVISDMAQGIRKAVKEIFPAAQWKVCSFHFLKDVGGDMLRAVHDSLKYAVRDALKILKESRKDLVGLVEDLGQNVRKKDKSRYEHLQWIISMIDRIADYRSSLNGQGFPFDLPHLAFWNRFSEISQVLEQLLKDRVLDNDISNYAHWMLNGMTNLHQRSAASIKRVEKINAIFSLLRSCLRPQEENTGKPLNWGLLEDGNSVVDTDKALATIQAKAQKKLAAKSISKYEQHAWKVIYKHLKKYKKALVSSIIVNDKVVVLPQTNNLSEIGFRWSKRKMRLITGNGRLARQLDELPAQFFYTMNLKDKEYIRDVFANKEIWESFHEADPEAIRVAMNDMKVKRRGPDGVNRKLIRDKDYLEMVRTYFFEEICA
jgi:hypothetical protein